MFSLNFLQNPGLVLLSVWDQIDLVSEVEDCQQQTPGTSAFRFGERLARHAQPALRVELMLGLRNAGG